MANASICPVCKKILGPAQAIYTIDEQDYHPECYEKRGTGRVQARPRPQLGWRRGVELAASKGDALVTPEEHPENPVSTPSGEPKGGEAGVPELVVILEALLDVKDIVLSDGDEASQLRSALARVTRETSIATWARAEPPAMTEWRMGVLRRAARSDVAAAILHALEPYHGVIRRADPTRPVAVLQLPADGVIAVRQRAVMSAWSEQMEQTVAHDTVELGEWLRYCITAHSSAGTREEDIVTWRQKVTRRAEAGSEAAARVVESIRQRDQAMAALAAGAAPPAVFVVHVPGVPAQTQTAPPAEP